jgi:hypothetical protein
MRRQEYLDSWAKRIACPAKQKVEVRMAQSWFSMLLETSEEIYKRAFISLLLLRGDMK